MVSIHRPETEQTEGRSILVGRRRSDPPQFRVPNNKGICYAKVAARSPGQGDICAPKGIHESHLCICASRCYLEGIF